MYAPHFSTVVANGHVIWKLRSPLSYVCHAFLLAMVVYLMVLVVLLALMEIHHM